MKLPDARALSPEQYAAYKRDMLAGKLTEPTETKPPDPPAETETPPVSTTSGTQKPAAGPLKGQDARALSGPEYAAAKAELISRWD